MTVELALIGSISLVLLYLDGLAVITLVRDECLTGMQCLAWCALTLFIPVLGAVLTLRNAAELNPDALPSRWFLMPALPLLHVAAAPAGIQARDDLGIGIYGSDAMGRHDNSGPGGSGPVI